MNQQVAKEQLIQRKGAAEIEKEIKAEAEGKENEPTGGKGAAEIEKEIKAEAEGKEKEQIDGEGAAEIEKEIKAK